MIDHVLFALIVFLALCYFYGFLRNNAVCHVRMEFIDFYDFPESYHKLPSYGEMLFSPKHLHRWTVRQWAKWVEAQ